MPDKKQIGTQFTRALFDIKTVNDEARTIDVVFATETPVPRQNWDGTYIEILDCNPNSVRMGRLEVGAPVLDNHNKERVADQIGVVESAVFINKEGRATIRFSNRDSVKDIWNDVKSGIIRGISVRYIVWAYEITEKQGEMPVYRATDWEPMEISLAPIPADYNSGTRSQENLHTVTINSKIKENNMPEQLTAEQRSQQIQDAVRHAGFDEAYATELINDKDLTVDGARTAIIEKLGKEKPKPAAKPQPAAEKPATESKERAADIVHAVRAAGMGIDYAWELLSDETMTADKARAAILNKMAQNQPPAQRSANTAAVVIGADDQVKERSALEFALMSRAGVTGYVIGAANNAASVMAEKFRGISLIEAARMVLAQRGIELKGYSKQEVYERSMSTSDFPNILSTIANKILRSEYEQAPQSFKALASQQNLPDFKSASGLQFGGSITFDEVKEGAEFKYGKQAETADSWKLSTYGKLVKMTRQMIINDDLGAFARVNRRIAQGAYENESNLFWSLITSNVKMLDGLALFHANHGNLAASGAVLDATTMNAARTAMRRQKGLDANEIITIAPKYIVVAPEQEMAADQLLTNITPNQTGQVNPFTAAGLQKIVEPRLAATAWYVFAQLMDAFTYGYLDGNEGLFTETRYGFEVDGVEIKARQDFAVKAWDWRGVYKNPGA